MKKIGICQECGAKKARMLPIPGYEKYFISKTGCILSYSYGNSKVFTYRKKPLHLKINKNKKGYSYVCLSKKGEKKYKQIHVLLLETFVSKRPSRKHQAAHLDGNSQNNCLKNLKWVTAKENQSHRLLHGTDIRGEKNGRAFFTNKQVLEIINLLKKKVRPVRIAEKFGVYAERIYDIKSGYAWSSVTGIKKVKS